MSSTQQPPALKEVLEAAEKLPPFPDVMWKVMPLIRNMAPVNEIEAVIRFDPIITAKVLAFSQSPTFNRKHSIGSLRDAIIFLGQQNLIQVIVAACASRYFANEPVPGYDLRAGEMWEHSVATALMTEIVGRHIGRTDLLTAYTAGLLHDIGKTVLNLYVHAYFDSIFAMVREKKMRFLEAEREVLGVDHQQLGTMIARKWNLPAEVVAAIGHHHSPADAVEHGAVAALVYVADRMVTAMGIGCGVDSFLQPNQDEVFSQMGLTPRMIDSFLADLVIRLKDTKQFLSS
ncbi:MAG: HDOD domain-containing protein [Acidobacteriota bacterium]